MARLGFKIEVAPAEDIVDLARLTEKAGFDEFWVCEDLSLAGGIAQVAAASAVTSRLQVGLGIAPAAVRNAMYLAMELSAVSRLSDGRFASESATVCPDGSPKSVNIDRSDDLPARSCRIGARLVNGQQVGLLRVTTCTSTPCRSHTRRWRCRRSVWRCAVPKALN